MSVKSYEDLEVWQLGMEIAEITYRFDSDISNKKIFNLYLKRSTCWGESKTICASR
jgi:hypothetical protein